MGGMEISRTTFSKCKRIPPLGKKRICLLTKASSGVKGSKTPLMEAVGTCASLAYFKVPQGSPPSSRLKVTTRGQPWPRVGDAFRSPRNCTPVTDSLCCAISIPVPAPRGRSSPEPMAAAPCRAAAAGAAPRPRDAFGSRRERAEAARLGGALPGGVVLVRRAAPRQFLSPPLPLAPENTPGRAGGCDLGG